MTITRLTVRKSERTATGLLEEMRQNSEQWTSKYSSRQHHGPVVN